MGLVQDLKGASRLGVLVAVAAATVGIIYGYDSSNIGGAMLFISKQFHLSTHQQEWVTTAVVIGEVIGALFGGALSNRLGRKKVMVTVAATFALFSLISALAWSVPSLMTARFFLGLTIGVSVVVVPVFVAESAAAAIRGAMLVLYQVATVTGIILGYLVAWALAGTGSWRWMLGAAAIPGFLITLLLLRLPDTPRWYMMKGRRADAERVLGQIEPTADVAAEIDAMEADLAETTANGRSTFDALKEMFRTPYLRAALFVVGLGFFVQITGINAIVYYSPRIFEAMGFSGHFALLGLPALVQVAGLAAVFVSMILVDRMGRRPILLTGIAIMVLANALLVLVFTQGSSFGGALTALGFIGLLLFTVGFTFGFGALVWVYAGESFPAHLRSLGSSAMLTSDLVANVVVGLVFLSMLQQLGGAGTFVVFGLLAVAAFAFVAKLAPETKGRQLEDIRHYWENGGRWPESDASAHTSPLDAQ
ncbi:putative sugar-transport integral membrane protein [Nostocoides japonicum T1-X7]|uniref:Putative sugar-transport integral membrane protein n=1 Tax=Nostocoides japonicum T1-X7 TaxID=1194083 RepID=A0A077LTS7_9MICO|nr:sugar porter family MFS transporter [Tetrasphaera japonica]CCH75902.1 putative sugar-transport integral membrane protein [Tetrasphaera japonica T1-X7]